MLKPVIMSVDDEPVVLNTVGRDLHAKYQKDYQIVEAGSGREALDAVLRFKQRNTPIALFLVDQRMPDMTGTEFLARAKNFFPDAKRVLLTAYSDTEAAIQSINSIGLDFYMLKPWDPPEEKLYPLLDELLGEWYVKMHPPYHGIRVVGAAWSTNSRSVKDFLTRNQIPYQWLDIELDREAQTLIETLDEGNEHLPVVFFPNGSVLIEPENVELAEKAGLNSQTAEQFYDLIVVGAGPAGLGAAVYSGSKGLKTLLIEQESIGGQADTSSNIDNFFGFPIGISGAEFARKQVNQARNFGVEILFAQRVEKVRVEDPYRFVSLSDSNELSCQTLLIATGVDTHQLDKPGIGKLSGKGVYYGASLAEAVACKDQDIFIFGDSNSAGQAAIILAQYARKVTFLSPSSSIARSMSVYLVNQISEVENIEVLDSTDVVEVNGKDQLESVTFTNRDNGKTKTAPTGAMFIFIGAAPRSEFVDRLLERDQAGYILTGQDLVGNGKQPGGWKLTRDPFYLETSVPGIFAAGDIRHGSVKRVAAAISEGAMAVKLIDQYLNSV
jgi:thioredoxin reductase (NADPH)